MSEDVSAYHIQIHIGSKNITQNEAIKFINNLVILELRPRVR